MTTVGRDSFTRLANDTWTFDELGNVWTLSGTGSGIEDIEVNPRLTPIGGTNSGFELGSTAQWTAGGAATLALESITFKSGSFAGKITSAASADPRAEHDKVAVSPDTTYRLSGWLRPPVALPGNAAIAINWYTSGDVFISTSTLTFTAPTAGAWTYKEQDFVSPSTAAKAAQVFSIVGTPGAGVVLLCDDVDIFSYDTSNSVGRIVNRSTSSRTMATPVEKVQADTVVVYSTDKLVSGASALQTLYVAMHRQDDDNQYLFSLTAKSDQSMHCQIFKRVTAIQTNVTSEMPANITHVVNKFYAIRARITGTSAPYTLSMRAWVPTDPGDPTLNEPVTWNVQGTDTTLTLGHIGIRTLTSASHTMLPVTYSVNYWLIDDLLGEFGLDEFSFRLKDDGILLNPSDQIFPFVDVYKVSGLDSAPFRETERDHEGVDGGFLDAEFEKGRPIVLEGVALGDVDVLLPLLEDLKVNFRPSRDLIPFYYKAPAIGSRVLFVKPRGVRYDWNQAIRHGETPIQFQMYAEDPRQYTPILETGYVPWAAAPTNGIGFNLGFNFGFGTAAALDNVIVFNSGNRETPAVITINGPVTNPRIVNDTLGLTLLFTIVLGVTDTLAIDLGSKTVRLNNVVNQRGSLQSPNWFLLQPGQNFFRYQGDLGTGSSMKIEFRSAWR